jgi:hypothetical protein
MGDFILPTWRLRATLIYGYANLWYAQQHSPVQITDKNMFLTCRLHYVINLKQTLRRTKIRVVLRGTTKVITKHTDLLLWTSLDMTACPSDKRRLEVQNARCVWVDFWKYEAGETNLRILDEFVWGGGATVCRNFDKTMWTAFGRKFWR